MEYSASFTGAGLLFEEFESVHSVFFEDDRENLLLREVSDNRYLKINSEAARKRVVQEIRKRIKFTTVDFWTYYQKCTADEKKLLLFYLVLKTYKLIYDFHFNVTIPMALSLNFSIDPIKYHMRLQEIISKNAAVAKWSASTLEKVITRYVYMLESAGLSYKKVISKPRVALGFFHYFIKQKEYWALDAFFLKQHEKTAIIKNCNDN